MLGQNLDQDRLMTRYLLGELSEPEQIQLEEAYFADENFFQQMLAAEDELIDAYARGTLSASQRERFESYFLNSTRRLQRVEFAGLLSQYVNGASSKQDAPSQEPQRHSSWWQSTLALLRAQNPLVQFAAASILLVICALVFRGMWQRTRPTPDSQQARREIPRTQPQDSQPPIIEDRQAGSKNSAQTTATLILTPLAVRSESAAHTLSLARDTTQVQLQLYLEQDDYKSYRAELQRIEESSIPLWHQDALEPQSKDSVRVIVLNLPASLFSAGDYRLKLSGLTDDHKAERVADYSFNVAAPK